MFRELGRSVGDAILEGIGRTASRVREARPLPGDLLESDDGYLVLFDAAGATASDIQVRFRNGAVLTRIDRFRDHREGYEMRYPGRGLALDGRVRLPRHAAVDPEAASATLRENGTLEVFIPKRDGSPAGGAPAAAEEAPERIDIDTAGDDA